MIPPRPGDLWLLTMRRTEPPVAAMVVEVWVGSHVTFTCDVGYGGYQPGRKRLSWARFVASRPALLAFAAVTVYRRGEQVSHG